MKIFLDSKIKAPTGWISAKCVKDVIDLLKYNDVSEISLSDNTSDFSKGIQVITYLIRVCNPDQENIFFDYFQKIPIIHIHNVDSYTRANMMIGIFSLQVWRRRNYD